MASAVIFMFGMMLMNCSETQALQFGSEHSSISINSALPSESFQIAKATFLPNLKDSEIGFSDNELDGDYNSKKCRGYDATSCPAGAVCKRCPFDYTKVKIIRCGDGWAKNGDICTPASCSAINSKYIDSVPKGKICTAVTEYNKLCYKDCRDVSCEGYTLDCDDLPANAESMTTCKDCTSANANCESNMCKISQCADGYKIANNGTACVALDDTCPEGYYKECETGFEGSPQYTEKGTACYQCKANTESNLMPILYANRQISRELLPDIPAIGIVVSEEKKIAMALEEFDGIWWADPEFDIPTLNKYPEEEDALLDWNGQYNTEQIMTYCTGKNPTNKLPRCWAASTCYEYATAGTNPTEWYLPSAAELNEMYKNFDKINASLTLIGSPTIDYTDRWSSTESVNKNAWQVSSYNALWAGSKIDFHRMKVLPFFKYGEADVDIPEGECNVDNCQLCVFGQPNVCNTCNPGYYLSDGFCYDCNSDINIEKERYGCKGFPYQGQELQYLTCDGIKYCTAGKPSNLSTCSYVYGGTGGWQPVNQCSTSTYRYASSNCKSGLGGSRCGNLYTSCTEPREECFNKLTCPAESCSGYTLTSCPTNGNCSKCTKTAQDCSTDGTRYKLDSCASGFVVSGNSCREQTCEEKGQKTCNGSCIATSECCGGCASGQKCENGTCVAACTTNSCPGYTMSFCPTTGNCSKCTIVSSNCTTGATKYKLDSCKPGYVRNGLTSCMACTSCPGYTLTTPAGCVTGYQACNNCGVLRYKCKTVSCSGYGLQESPIGSLCTPVSFGGMTCYNCAK